MTKGEGLAQASVERIGHRGAPREYPENTVPSFLRAFEFGADAVELDVHGTADGEVIVHHDPMISRRANAHRGRPIASLSLADLRVVELAPGIGIPTLDEVLAVVPRGKRVYVEIKGAGIEAPVAAVLRGSQHDCAVHSFDHSAIVRLQAIAPEIPRGILFDRPIDVASAMRDTGARDVWPKWTLIDRAIVDEVHANRGRVIAWTVNSPRAARALVAAAVDGLCGDDVRELNV